MVFYIYICIMSLWLYMFIYQEQELPPFKTAVEDLRPPRSQATPELRPLPAPLLGMELTPVPSIAASQTSLYPRIKIIYLTHIHICICICIYTYISLHMYDLYIYNLFLLCEEVRAGTDSQTSGAARSFFQAA